MTCTEIPGLVISAFVVDRIGRKFTMVVMFVLGSILLLPLMFHQNQFFTTTLLFGARTFVSATFTIACIYTPEVCFCLNLSVDFFAALVLFYLDDLHKP